MHNWRWDNPCPFADQVDRSNLQTPSSGNFKLTGERFSWYSSDDLRAKIEQPSCRQSKPGNLLAVRPVNWAEIIDKHDDNENWSDPGAPRGGRSRPGDATDNDDGGGEEVTQGQENRTGNEKGTKDVKGNRKGKGKAKWKVMEEGKGKGNGKGNGILKQIPGEDDISRAVAFQLQQEMYEADSDMEGYLEQVYLELEAAPAMSISPDDDTDSAESHGEYNSEQDSDVDMSMKDEVDAPDGVDLDGDVDM